MKTKKKLYNRKYIEKNIVKIIEFEKWMKKRKIKIGYELLMCIRITN